MTKRHLRTLVASKVEYLDGSPTEPGSGEPVEMQGQLFLGDLPQHGRRRQSPRSSARGCRS